MKIIQYISLVMAIIYLIAGLWIGLGKYFFENMPDLPNPMILGGLLFLYGCFRLYRFIKITKSTD